jgi:hypothetical protein
MTKIKENKLITYITDYLTNNNTSEFEVLVTDNSTEITVQVRHAICNSVFGVKPELLETDPDLIILLDRLIQDIKNN